jgi:hypothetical protein
MIEESTEYKVDWPFALLTTSVGLVSALLTMCIQYPYAIYTVSHQALDFGQDLLPGIIFGTAVSCCFALRGYLRDVWRAVVMVLAFAASYFFSVQAAVGVELHSPYLAMQDLGHGSCQAMFAGGLVGGFCIVSVVLVLLNSRTSWKLKMFCGATVGALLGVTGRTVAPIINPPLWQFVHSLGLTSPDMTLRNTEGLYEFSLWAVWQAGMGFVLALAVNRKQIPRLSSSE